MMQDPTEATWQNVLREIVRKKKITWVAGGIVCTAGLLMVIGIIT